MGNSIYLKHIKVIKENPQALVGKTIVSLFTIDRHGFFFKDQEGQMYYYLSFLTSREILPGLSLDQNPMIKGFVEGEEKLYIYPSIYDGNMFNEYEKLEGWKDNSSTRYQWVKDAFEFGIFNNVIKNDYLEKLKQDYRDHAKQEIINAENRLKGVKKQYESLT